MACLTYSPKLIRESQIVIDEYQLTSVSIIQSATTTALPAPAAGKYVEFLELSGVLTRRVSFRNYDPYGQRCGTNPASTSCPVLNVFNISTDLPLLVLFVFLLRLWFLAAHFLDYHSSLLVLSSHAICT